MADVYSRFVTEAALRDLDENVSDYEVTYSNNRYFMSRIQEAAYLKVYEQISEADRQLLKKIYAFDEKYRQYNITTWPSEEDRTELQRIFMFSDLIPQTTSPNTLIIDISWTENAYYKHAR